MDAIDADVGHRLRVRRTLLGLSQEELAGRLGLTFQQVQKYENGTNRITAGRLYRLATILGVPVEYFFQGFADEDLPQKALRREILELIRAYGNIRDAGRRAEILRFLHALGKDRDEASVTPMTAARRRG